LAIFAKYLFYTLFIMFKQFYIKTTVLLGLTLFLFACSKETAPMEQEIQTEELASLHNKTFVSQSKATNIAAAFLGTRSHEPATKSNARLASTKTIRDNKSNEPLMYVMNYIDGGFVVVSATKNYYPILAYSDENPFVLKENLGEMGGVAIWLEETKEYIRQSEFLDGEKKAEIRNLWRQYEPITNMITTNVATKSGTPEQDAARDLRIAQLNNMGYSVYSIQEAFDQGLITINNYQNWWNMADVAPDYTLVAFGSTCSYSQVGPFLQTAWSQWGPFNNQVPLINGKRPLLGCNAVAFGQIMAYHEHPSTINWSTIKQQGGLSIETQNFLYILALDIGTIFDVDKGSSSKHSDAMKELKSSKYGYSSTISEISHNSATVRSQLSLAQPVYMRGDEYDQVEKKYTSHGWVCDGYNSYTYSDFYFAEFLMGSPGSYSYSSLKGAPSLQNPNYTSGMIHYSYSMNWGHGGMYNGWFVGEYVNMNYTDSDYQYDRKEVINIKKP